MKRALTTLALIAACGLVLSSAAAPATTVAPSNTALPTITGTAQESHTLTAQSGSWSGTTPIVFSYQWRRCDANGANCADIAGATGQTRVAAAADVNMTLRIAVTATNSSGAGNALSDPTPVVTGQNAPFSTQSPEISGTAQQDQTLSTSSGNWTGTQPIAFAYAWQRCDQNGSGCNTISGATAQTYKLTSDDVAHTVRSKVTATNSSGSSSATSGSSAVIAAPGSAPANSSPPSVTGTLLSGSKLSVSPGGWSGTTPLTYTYRWQRCDANGNNCATIAGASSQTYTLTSAEINNRIRGVVTATNTAGTTTAYSTLTGTIGSIEPVNTALPKITGTLAIGQTLTTTTGTWSGATPLQFSYQWQRNVDKTKYSVVAGATQSTYKPTSADAGHTLIAQVKAQNSHGSSWANSTPTGTISSTPSTTGALPVSSVSLPDRLVISRVAFTPAALTSRNPFQIRVRVTNLQGRPVQGALVYPLGLPYTWIKNPVEQATKSDGWTTVTVVPTAHLPIGKPQAFVVFVRARKPGENVLGGITTRRLVQVKIR